MVAGAAAWLWVLAVLLPIAELGFGGTVGAVLAASFPVCVAMALLAERLEARQAIVQGALLVLAPLGLVASLAHHEALASREVLGAVHASLLLVAAGVYVASIGHAASARVPRRAARSQALPPSSRLSLPSWPRRVRGVLVGLAALGSVALVAIVPLMTGHAARVERHGFEGADSALLLAGAVGVALGVMVLGGIVGPALRARNVDTRSRWRGLLWLGVALSAAAAWAWLSA